MVFSLVLIAPQAGKLGERPPVRPRAARPQAADRAVAHVRPQRWLRRQPDRQRQHQPGAGPAEAGAPDRAGVDPRRRGQRLLPPHRRQRPLDRPGDRRQPGERSGRAGRVHDLPAGDQGLPGRQRAGLQAEDPRGVPRARAREGAQQEPDPVALRQQRVLRQRRLRRAGGGAGTTSTRTSARSTGPRARCSPPSSAAPAVRPDQEPRAGPRAPQHRVPSGSSRPAG